MRLRLRARHGAVGSIEGGAEFAAHRLGLAVELGAADLEHARVGGRVLGQGHAGGRVEARVVEAETVEDGDDVALVAGGEEGAPTEAHRRRRLDGGLGDDLRRKVGQTLDLGADRRTGGEAAEVIVADRVARLPDGGGEETLFAGGQMGKSLQPAVDAGRMLGEDGAEKADGHGDVFAAGEVAFAAEAFDRARQFLRLRVEVVGFEPSLGRDFGPESGGGGQRERGQGDAEQVFHVGRVLGSIRQAGDAGGDRRGAVKVSSARPSSSALWLKSFHPRARRDVRDAGRCDAGEMR